MSNTKVVAFSTELLEVSIQRKVSAPRQAVFAAWTDVEQLKQWWGPRDQGRDFSAPSVDLDARSGGSYRICIRSPRGDDYWMAGVYREVRQGERLVFTQLWDDQPNVEGLITVTFTGSGDGTVVSFHKAGFASIESRDSELEGWHECLDRLVGYFATARAGRSDDEIEIRRMIANWSRALEAKDVDRLVADYEPDAVVYDVKPPYRVRGIEACRQMWESCLPCFPDKIKSEHRDLSLTVSGDVAVCHALHRIKAVDELDHQACQTWIRVTVGYRKTAGRWRVMHEHVSLPFDPMTGMVTMIADPDAAVADAATCA